MNPCPCGYLGSNSHYCTCTPKQIQAYRNRISGPVHDRIDILLSLQPVDISRIQVESERSVDIHRRVEKAQEIQFLRYQKQVYNSNIPFEILTSRSPLSSSQLRMIAQISSKQHWSNRVQIKIIRLARTISDLAAEEKITDESIW